MLTPKLEELILCGKAFQKTYIAGGSNKSSLRFGNDRFIVITDITYFPFYSETNPEPFQEFPYNTQLAIYGQRGFTHYIFRNYVQSTDQLGNVVKQFMDPTTINTYLVHEQEVGFSFSNAPYLSGLSVAPAPATDNPSYKPPLEYGKIGDPGVISTVTQANAFGGLTDYFTDRIPAGTAGAQGLQFPVSAATSYTGFINNNPNYNICIVNYVEVLGQPNNIAI